jgi:hypothetical protein
MSAGHEVLGYDIVDFSAVYPGRFVQADLLHHTDFPRADFIVASPPCTEFTRASLPRSWAAARKPADIEGACRLFRRAFEIVKIVRPQFGFIVENVRGAQKFCGPAREHMGSRYLWGSYPPFQPVGERKELYGKWRLPPRADRAVVRSLIPYPISYGLGIRLKHIENMTATEWAMEEL